MATRQYIGARYVPKFYENSNNTAEWQSGVIYEPLTIVTYNGNSYTSKKIVPASVGNPSSNPGYWVATGIYNEQLGRLSPLYTLAMRSFSSTEDMRNADIPANSFAFCKSYYGGNGEPIYYFIDENDRDFAIQLDNGNYAHPIINRAAVYVSQFGAIGNASIDDTTAIQNAIDYAGNNGVVHIDRERCKISATLNIPYSRFQLVGGNHPEYVNAIYVPENEPVSPVINITGQIFSMNGVMIQKEFSDRTARSGIGVRVKFPDPSTSDIWYNMDAYFRKCYFLGFQLCADVYGRNVIFEDDCHFSNSDCGVHYHSKNGTHEASQRGWIVQNCRFHSMGKAVSYADPDTAPDVAVQTDLNSLCVETIIRNNIFDGGCVCMMYRGVSDGLIIEGNTVEQGNRVTIGIIKRPGTGIGPNIFPKVKNNVFDTASVADNGVYTNTMIELSGTRLIMTDNFIRNSFQTLVKYSMRDTGTPILAGIVLKGNVIYTDKSNCTYMVADADTQMTFYMIGNIFGLTGGASGNSVHGDCTIINSANYAECNGADSGVTL